MSFFKKRPKTETTSEAKEIKTPVQAREAEKASETQETAKATPSDVPPWAVASCRACNGKGINSKGQPCRACDVVQDRTGGVTSSQFETWVDNGGMLRWKPAGGTSIVPNNKEEPETAAPSPVQATKNVTGIAAVGETVISKAIVAGQELKREPTKLERRKAKPEGGFDLFVGCIPLGQQVTMLANVLDVEGQELAEVLSPETRNYYSLNAFERRDSIASKAKEIAATLTGNVHVPSEMTPDERALYTALTPFARQVIMRT